MYTCLLLLDIWVGGFKLGSPSLEAESKSRCSLLATDEEMCNKVRDLEHCDWRVQVEDITKTLASSYGNVSTNLYDQLVMRKLAAR